MRIVVIVIIVYLYVSTHLRENKQEKPSVFSLNSREAPLMGSIIFVYESRRVFRQD